MIPNDHWPSNQRLFHTKIPNELLACEYSPFEGGSDDVFTGYHYSTPSKTPSSMMVYNKEIGLQKINMSCQKKKKKISRSTHHIPSHDCPLPSPATLMD